MGWLDSISQAAETGASIYETIETTKAKVKAAKKGSGTPQAQVVFQPQSQGSGMSSQTLMLIAAAAVGVVFLMRRG